MRWLIFFVLVLQLFFCYGRKSDTALGVAQISGTWRVIKLISPSEDSVTVEKRSNINTVVLTINIDGAMLDRSGQLICCFPNRSVSVVASFYFKHSKITL